MQVLKTRRIALIAAAIVVAIVAIFGLTRAFAADPEPNYNTSSTLAQDIDDARYIVNSTGNCSTGSTPQDCQLAELRSAVNGIAAKTDDPETKTATDAFAGHERSYDAECSGSDDAELPSCRYWSGVLQASAVTVVTAASRG